MQHLALFCGFEPSQIEKLLLCLDAKIKKCNTNETIMSHKEALQNIYVVISGTAELASYDYDGNKCVLERYGSDSIFGEMFFSPLGTEEFRVWATTPCEILSFPYNIAMSQCENSCSLHTKFLDNLFKLISQKLLEQSQHIEILTKRTTREKLLAYFELQSIENDSFSFLLPMSLSSLSDYLGVDRCAMQREIKHLNDEGIILSKAKKITLLKKVILS